MSKLLYLQASPQGERSYSNRLGDALVQAYRQSHPRDEIVTLNVFQRPLPPFDGPAVAAKYVILHGQKHTPQHRLAWDKVEALIAEFKTADKYVLASPMWNFSIPYQLKLYFDILVQPGYTFTYSPQTGYQGLVTGKPICLLLARGGSYAQPQLAALDLQKRYLELILGFIGFTDIRTVIVEPTLAGGPDAAQRALDDALQHARKLALEL